MKKKLINLKALIIVLVTSLVIPLFFSCNGDEDYEDLEFYPYALHGYVTDLQTGEPLKNVSFNINCGQRTYGMVPAGKRFVYKGVAKTDSRGYYKIRIPKGNEEMAYNVVYVYPQNISGYNFVGGDFDVGEKWDNKPFVEEAIRSDIKASSYGYLKVFVPINGTKNWYTNVNYEGSYQFPLFIGSQISETSNNEYKIYFYKTSAGDSWGVYEYPVDVYNFTVPRHDTLDLYINEQITEE